MTLPTATYRLQFREGMDFARAAGIVPYLAELGVSHLYASPLFQATEGSTHGYDVTDHRRFDESLGGQDGFVDLSEALRRAGLGLILDIVPNHMAASVQNPWWHDVLRHGRDSRYAGHFDIDWSAPRLVLPMLGQPYGDALAASEFALGRDGDGLCLRYYEHAFPLSRDSERMLAEAAGAGSALPDDAALDRLSQDRALIHKVHESQAWRLAYWRLARDGLTYRRFFEISDLVGVRVEEPHVFDDVHRFLFEMIEAGHIHGVRVDHVDGLADPTGYLDRLAREMPRDVPVWVEKIVARGEALPAAWPVVGTTGYEFADSAAAVLTDRDGIPPLSEGYDAFTGSEHDFEAMRDSAKREILTANLAAELDILTDLAGAALRDDPSGRDWGRDSLRRALTGILLAMPVYRTYLDGSQPSPTDAALLQLVAREARDHAGLDDPAVIDALLGHLSGTSDADRGLRVRLQQTTGALMAKAVEDTLFYRYNRLISANEVGAEPDSPALDLDAFADAMRLRAEAANGALGATATHDTKRGEDARMRIAAISEMPEKWLSAVATFDASLDHSIDAETRWLFYEALLGGWEDGGGGDLRDRVSAFLLKAAREAKTRTSWVRADEAFEASLDAFVGAAFARPDFLSEFSGRSAPFIEIGRRKSLVQLALKLTAPGIPDIYQGTELPDLSFVDPDNRRPVDFDGLQRRLREGAGQAGKPDKLSLMRHGLALRRQHPDLFARAGFDALASQDRAAGRTMAFERRHAGQRLVVVADLSGRWDGAASPVGEIAGTEPLAEYPGAPADPGRDRIAQALSTCSVFIGFYAEQ